MNKTRETEIQKIINELGNLQNRLEKLLSDEEDFFNGIPENRQSSEIAEDSERALEVLEDAAGSLEEIAEALEEII